MLSGPLLLHLPTAPQPPIAPPSEFMFPLLLPLAAVCLLASRLTACLGRRGAVRLMGPRQLY